MKFSLFYVYLNSLALFPFPYFAFFVDWLGLIFIHSFVLAAICARFMPPQLGCSSLCSSIGARRGFKQTARIKEAKACRDSQSIFIHTSGSLHRATTTATRISHVKSCLKTVLLFWYINSKSLFFYSFHINYCFVQIKQEKKWSERKSRAKRKRKYKSSLGNKKPT